jgi:hypothetical protein
MKTLKSALAVAGVTVAAVFAFASPAMAGDHDDQWTSHNYGALNGNQLDLTNQLGINVCGLSVAVLGFANSNADCGNFFD